MIATAKKSTALAIDPGSATNDAKHFVDGATLVSILVVLQLLVPARLVIAGIPLSLSPAAVFSLLIGLCWVCAQFTNTLGVAKGRNPVRTMVFLYSCSILATYGIATYGYLPADELNQADRALVVAFGSVGLALGTCDGVRGRERLYLVLQTVAVVGTLVAVVGTLQFLFDVDLTHLKLPGLRATSDDAFIIERSDLRRVGATTAHPIEFGVVCATLVPLAVHLAMRARRMGRRSLPWWMCTSLIAAGLMFSISRSAILGLATAAVVLFLGWPSRWRLSALAAVAAFLILMKIAIPGLLRAFYNLFANIGNDDSVQYRTHDYATAALEISRHFWLGRGLGTWYAPKHQVFDNQYLLSAVEIGVLGLTAFLGIFVAGIYSALRARSLSRDVTERDLGLTLAAMLVVPLVGCATFDLGGFATANALAILTAGAAGSLLRTAKSANAEPAAGPTSARTP